MTDLKQKLEAAGNRQGKDALNKQIFERGGIPPNDEICPPEAYRYYNGYLAAHFHLHPQIIKLVEALEKCKRANERLNLDAVASEFALSRVDLAAIADQALAEFHSALEGV